MFMLTTAGPSFFPFLRSVTSMEESLSLNSTLEQFPSFPPSHFSFFLATHSLPSKLDSLSVVQQVEPEQILILISSSDPTAPTWTSIFLKTKLEAAETETARSGSRRHDILVRDMLGPSLA